MDLVNFEPEFVVIKTSKYNYLLREVQAKIPENLEEKIVYLRKELNSAFDRIHKLQDEVEILRTKTQKKHWTDKFRFLNRSLWGKYGKETI